MHAQLINNFTSEENQILKNLKRSDTHTYKTLITKALTIKMSG